MRRERHGSYLQLLLFIDKLCSVASGYGKVQTNRFAWNFGLMRQSHGWDLLSQRTHLPLHVK